MLEVSISKQLDSFTLHSAFSVGKEMVGILGPSGCGKSMTLRCIAGLLRPDEGRIVLNGKVIFDATQNIHIAPRIRNIGYVFQNYALFPHLTVSQNISFGLKHLDNKERQSLVCDMIEKMQLHGLQSRYPSELSGGQQQRVALARTLITRPELLLLDEPFSAVDSHVKSLLEQELLSMIRENYSGTVLLVTHNIDEAYRLCNRMMIYANGQIVQMGSKEELLRNPVNLTASQITGCKNLLPVEIEKSDGEKTLVRLHNMQLYISQKSSLKTKSGLVGARSHHVQVGMEPFGTNNSFSCQIKEVSEGLFSVTLFLQYEGYIIQADISESQWIMLKKNKISTVFVHIPPENLFLIEDDYLKASTLGEGNNIEQK
ncbi:sulfate/molybdate ABC transporter ATP-binding protein [Brevibacillus sp. SYSU BS000544]|uniref:sulfate/molybdate ABC transporter ATP-binding protein n=1 Tax=Brevibacillus sp. SYSU BS000544 TaxID=3416443 RepID=UPI003CE45EBD